MSENRIQFAVKSNIFDLYTDFKEKCEELGWKYNREYSLFIESNMNYNDCLYFDSKWNNLYDDAFSFHNKNNIEAGISVFDLDTIEGWEGAVEMASKINGIVKNGKTTKDIGIKNNQRYFIKEIDDFKEFLVNQFIPEYEYEEAVDMINKAEIVLKGDRIKITYDNGVVDLFEIASETKYYLKHIE